jgi:hypothetical protein
LAHGFAPAAAVDQVVPIGNQVGERAAVVAEGHAAIHAARGLGAHFLARGNGTIDFEPVVDALGGGRRSASLARYSMNPVVLPMDSSVISSTGGKDPALPANTPAATALLTAGNAGGLCRRWQVTGGCRFTPPRRFGAGCPARVYIRGEDLDELGQHLLPVSPGSIAARAAGTLDVAFRSARVQQTGFVFAHGFQVHRRRVAALLGEIALSSST